MHIDTIPVTHLLTSLEKMSHQNVNLENETLIHLFCNCNDSEDFWKKVSMLVFDIFDKIIKIDESMILLLNCNTGSEVVNNTLKVIILSKNYIY